MRKPEPRAAAKHHRDRQIQDALRYAHQGKLDIKYSPAGYPVRANWTQ